jgi:hypothetical protein
LLKDLAELLSSRKTALSQVWWGHVYNPSFPGGRIRRTESSRPTWVKVVRPCLKNKISKKAGNIAKVAEHLPTMCEALGPFPSTTKYQNKKC